MCANDKYKNNDIATNIVITLVPMGVQKNCDSLSCSSISSISNGGGKQCQGCLYGFSINFSSTGLAKQGRAHGQKVQISFDDSLVRN